ncbi:MAG TPA: ADOP family duplicated permease [Vicinamibacteria bacterium]|nr:ADOP family duplicated permease [Vicinamibacteria bacterium]
MLSSLFAILLDARLGFRTIRRRAGLAALAALTLAVGLASTMTAFSLVNALLLRPHPFTELERLVVLREQRTESSQEFLRLTPNDYLDLKGEMRTLDGVAAYRFSELNLSGDGVPESIRAFYVSGELFSILGVTAARGRVLSPDDSRRGNERAAVLSFGLFQRRFGAEPGVVGSEIFLNGAAHTVVGVMPQDINFPRGVDLWIPLALSMEESVDRTTPSLSVVARLRRGVSLEAARQELESFGERLSGRYPETHRERRFGLLRLREEQYVYTLPMFGMLQVASLLVLFLAAANVSNLVVVWRVASAHDVAIRAALGASRVRLFRQSFLECLVIAAAAFVAALPLSFGAIELIRNAMPQGIATFVSGWRDIRLDPESVATGFTVAIVLTGLLSGVGAAGSAARPFLDALSARARGVTGGRKSRLRAGLVGAQIALALVLLSGAVWLLRGFEQQMDVFGKLEPKGILTGRVSLPRDRYPDPPDTASFFERLLGVSSELPGATSVALVTNLPASNVPNEEVFFSIESREPATEGETPRSDLQVVGGAFFDLFRVPLLRGRVLNASDDHDAAPAVVVSETWLRRYLPDEEPLGRRVRLGPREADGEWRTIVGVVGDLRQNWFDPEPRPVFYLSYLQSPRSRMRITIRSRTEGYELVAPLREKLASVDPHQALAEPTTLEDEIADSLAPLRIIGLMLLFFAIVALALAATGVYAVVSTSVVERSRELGLRMALGAHPPQVLRQIIRQTLGLAVMALGPALPATFGLNVLLAGRLFGVVVVSPFTLLIAGALLAGIAAAAAYVPARTATRIDPVDALRSV